MKLSPLPDGTIANPAAIGRYQIEAARATVELLERIDARLARLEAVAFPQPDGGKKGEPNHVD